jgi:signal peptidase I
MPTVGKSMFPFLTGRDRIFISRCEQDKLRRGDLILFRRNNEENIYVAHRLMRKIKNAHGYTLVTKGDAHLNYDKPINSDLLIGKITKIKTPYASIYLEGTAGRIINVSMFLISLTRIIGFGLWFFKRIKILSYRCMTVTKRILGG